MYAFCGNFHYVCNVEDDEDVDALALIDSVDRAVQGDDVEGLTALLQRYNTIAQLVPERRAVQVIACGGILAAHFTLSHDLAEAIEVDN
jgi:hypothetical protein